MQIRMYYNYQLKLPYVTYRVKPNLVGYFPQPGEILANLGPGQFLKKANSEKKPCSNFDKPGKKWNIPCDLVEFWGINISE